MVRPLLPCLVAMMMMMMKGWVLLFLIPCISNLHEPGGRALACNATDLAALRSFAASFGMAGNFSDWDQTTSPHADCCAWPGVSCSSASSKEGQRVTNLSLDTVERILDVGSMQYPIPVSVCGLSELILLRLSSSPGLNRGRLWGSIPACVGSNLTKLVELDLSYNSLTGAIPLLFFPHLQTLRLYDNSLLGPFPSSSLLSLPSLITLDLSFNSFSGPFPSNSLLSLPGLTTLDLAGNSFSGPFPSSLLSLPNLTTLDLSGNSFSGPLPSPFNCPPLLQVLSLGPNSFNGSIPSFNAPLLRTLQLYGNSFTGNLSNLLNGPLSALPSLSELDLQSNALSGQIPTFDPSRFLSLQFLSLDDNLLNGSLPNSLCGLSNLSELSLTSNAFSGQFLQCKPPELNRLNYLEASFNNFLGPFPEWVGSLSILGLDHNSFSGSLPHSWQNMSNSLQELCLSGNSIIPESPGAPRLPNWLFTSTSILTLLIGSMSLQTTDLSCSSLLNNTMLGILDLSRNNLTSDVLQCLNPSSQFEILNLSGNPLSFSLNDVEMVQLLPHSLTHLEMNSCELSGCLSHHFLDRLTRSVETLSLAHNNLIGRIPAHLGNLSSLQDLDLSHNFFTGIDPLLHKFPYLYSLLVSNNSLEGSLSSLFFNMINITGACAEPDHGPPANVDLSHNRISGRLPPNFLGPCISPYVGRLKLNDNLLEGLIPNEFLQINNTGTLNYLETLSLSNNQLSGPIPASFKGLRRLTLLDLSRNMLNGSLQDRDALFANASFTKLRVLHLGYNDFTGSIPSSLGDIAPALQVIDFSNNHLLGTIPLHTLQTLSAFRKISTPPTLGLTVWGTLYEELRINVKGNGQPYVYVLEALTSLDLSGNNLSGPIPTGLGELAGLVYLNLARNNLSGWIPPDLGKLSQLQSLDLSFNAFDGPIPSSFRNLTELALFNVSYNRGLSGQIPVNQPQFEIAESYIGDPNLCGSPTLPSCDTPHESQSTMPGKENSSEFASWIEAWVSIPGFSLGIVAGFFGVLWILVLTNFF